MKLVTLFLPPRYIQELDQLVEAKLYPNRAEAIWLCQKPKEVAT